MMATERPRLVPPRRKGDGPRGQAQVIFSTVHGSRLYGLDHEGSDHDTLVVSTSRARKSSHSKVGDEDRVEIGIYHFIELATGGRHQAVEALFSPVKEWGPVADRWRPMLEGMRIGGATAFETYRRLVIKYAHMDTVKMRRHAVRLAWNLGELRKQGYIEVRLMEHRALYATMLAEKFRGDELLRVILR